MKLAVLAIIVLSLLSSISFTSAQSPRTQLPREQKPAVSKPPEPPSGDHMETIKIDTDLVTVPVIASSRTGNYIADLKKEEFKVSEDGVPQQIAFFAAVSVPFHLVLMLDTSDSTQDKLPQIQRAAIAFLDQLRPADRVKIISFDSELHDWNEFTNDKAILRDAIKQTRSGKGTRVYDAVQMALDLLRPINQRKAIVMFSDGMDWHSESSTFEGTVRDLDESGVIFYPIRFDTRADTERIARQQDAELNGTQLPTSEIIRQAPAGTTPPTFPSEEPFPVPNGQRRSPLPLPPPSVIFGRGNPNPPRDPRSADPFPGPGDRSGRTNPPPPPPPDDRRANDTISAMLDQAFLMADSYLRELADRSGGQVYRADTVVLLPQAFAAIAAELRTQYLLGYYPANRARDGAYRKIQVKTSRKDIAIRARPGYRAQNGG